MKHAYQLASATFAFSVGSGIVVVALPQTALFYHMSSDQIGMLTAAQPFGYAVGCIGLGQLFQNVCGKRVMLGGTVVSVAAVLGIATFHTVWPLVLSQFIYGIALGAFWPFTAAWMLENDDVPRTRLLRVYNAGWTSGAALGMYFAGVLCSNGYLAYTYFISVAVTALSCIGPLLTPGPRSHLKSADETQVTAPARDPIGRPILLAGIIANVTALGTRVMISFNYPELNKALNFDASRMGLFCAVALGGQLTAFLFGATYERFLGSRRLYALMSGALIATSLAFGLTTNLAILTAAMLIAGVVTAMGFQSAILAATEWFSSRRNGTTVHEGFVGFAQVLPWFAGLAVQHAKESGMETIAALKMPFFVLPAVLGVTLLVQIALVTFCKTRRLLLPRAEPSSVGLTATTPPVRTAPILADGNS